MFIHYNQLEADQVILGMRACGRPENITYRWLWFDRVFFDYIREDNEKIIEIFNEANKGSVNNEILKGSEAAKKAIKEHLKEYFSFLDMICSDKLRTDMLFWYCGDPSGYTFNCLRRWLFDSDSTEEVIRRLVWSAIKDKMHEICQKWYGCHWGYQDLDRESLMKYVEFEIPYTDEMMEAYGFEKLKNNNGEDVYMQHTVSISDETQSIVKVEVNEKTLTIYGENDEIRYRMPVNGTVKSILEALLSCEYDCDCDDLRRAILNYID